MEQATPEDYTYRSTEIIGDINGVIGELQSKLTICLSSDDVDDNTGDESEACDLNTDLKLVLRSLQRLNRRISL